MLSMSDATIERLMKESQDQIAELKRRLDASEKSRPVTSVPKKGTRKANANYTKTIQTGFRKGLTRDEVQQELVNTFGLASSTAYNRVNTFLSTGVCSKKLLK